MITDKQEKEYHQMDSIAVFLFGWSEQIQNITSPISVRQQDQNNHSDTETRCALSTIRRAHHSEQNIPENSSKRGGVGG